LESSNNTKARVLTATVGALITAGLWFVHLSDPSLVVALVPYSWLLFFAAPFVTAMSIGYLLFPEVTEGSHHETGPMSGYIRQVEADRRWKISVMAVAVGAVNLLFMFFS